MKRFLLLTISGFIFQISVGAQEVDKHPNQDTIALEEIVVTGSKFETSKKVVPFSVSQINRQEIENTGQINILPVLNDYVPGVFVTERNILGFGVATGGSGGINIRGIGGSPNTGVLVLIDGHPQFQGLFGHPLADAYVASDVQKVEIIRGPASVLYGTNAMGGVVNIITRKNEKNGFNGSLGGSYGSYNTQKYYGTAGYKGKKWDVYASLNHDRTDGIRENTDFNITNGYTKLGYQINDHFSLMADLMIAKYDANDNGPVFKPAPFHIDIMRGKTSFSLINKYRRSEGALKLYHNFGNHDLSDGFKSTDRNSGIMLYQTLRLFKGNTLTVGTDLKQYGGKANSGVARDSLKTVNEVAGYVYTQQTLVRILTVTGGIRAEHNSVWGGQWIPTAGVAVSPTNRTTFKATVAKGFRSPTIMEMYLYAPNPQLKPEQMVSYELSWLQQLLNNRLKLELTAYTANGKNLIQVAGIPPNMKRQNLGTFANKGIEFSANYFPINNLHLHANYSYLHQEKITLAAPRQQFNVNGNYTYKIWTFFTGLQYIDKLYSNLNPEILNSYALLNARVGVTPFKKISLFVAGNNLLDRKYEINYGYPMPGINVSGGITIRF
jgi:iron complex outermembrane receptor protein